jgi:hypothetical protein
MAKARAKTTRKKSPRIKKAPSGSRHYDVDWSDPVSVESALDKHFPDDIEDFEEDGGYSSFAEGTVYRFKSGGAEYAVAEDDDAAEKLAVAIVLQDLRESPENFEQNFIESHIDKERLRRDLHSDVWDSNYERLKEEAERSPMEFLKDNGLDIPEPSRDKMQERAEAMSDEETPAADIMKKLNDGDAEDKWIELGEDPEVPEKETQRPRRQRDGGPAQGPCLVPRGHLRPRGRGEEGHRDRRHRRAGRGRGGRLRRRRRPLPLELRRQHPRRARRRRLLEDQLMKRLFKNIVELALLPVRVPFILRCFFMGVRCGRLGIDLSNSDVVELCR